MVRPKVRVNAARRNRVPQAVVTAPNQLWSMDFMSAWVADGRWFRILTAVDQFTRGCLCLLADQSLTGEKVARLTRSRWTMAANSPGASWTSGSIVTESS
jgi:putative transposase